MTIPAIFSVAAGAVELVIGLLCLGFSQAPGWRHLRWFAFLALTAASFSACSVCQTLNVSDALVVWSGRLAVSVCALHCAGWLSYTSLQVDERALRRRGDRVLFALLIGIALCAPLPGVLTLDSVRVHEVAWLHARYASPETPVLGDLAFLFMLGTLLVPFLRYLRAAERRVPGALPHALAFIVLFAAACNEALVASNVLDTPYLLDLGFLGCVLAVSGDMTRRVVSGSHALIQLSQHLEQLVTERSAELARVQQALARSERLAALGHLSAGVAHEINNPLSFVRSNVDFLADQLMRYVPPELRAECEEAARETQDGVERIRRIALDLKVFARGPQAPMRETVDVRAVVESSLRLVRSEVRTRARLSTDFADIPAASGDASRLAQVVVNLVVNAAQAITPGREEDNEICVRTRASTGGRVVLEVQDSGPGIAPGVIAHIFEPYFTTKQASGGTGLGLAICHGIVTGMGGSIDVESVVGRGTIMRVTLPVFQSAAAPARSAA